MMVQRSWLDGIILLVVLIVLEDQTQALLAELIRQALIRIHSQDSGADVALYKAIHMLQEQNIINHVASSLQ